MAKKTLGFFAEYEENNEGLEQTDSLIDTEREYPLETRCCVTGEKVKHSFCRYPDPNQGTMMVMSRETMLQYSRKGQNLSSTFDQILQMRRKLESKG
ncbi:MAG: hypothetical protein O7G87_13940 [bacterium]|nr:hypothetical protein [bacterium]